MQQQAIQAFRQIVLDHFHATDRQLPWRDTADPYAITVSEIMLQQTQAGRVIPKYTAFIQRFPDWQTLAQANPTKVLQYWQGLGYNRRGLNLQKLAQIVCETYAGKIPMDRAVLKSLPGVGAYTSGAIITFAANLPEVFIETNIRRVYLHHFFPETADVSDTQLMPLIAETVDTHNPRIWYYALMDYGAYLGQVHKNANVRSKHYAKQSRFAGSIRQLRGKLVRLLIAQKPQSHKTIAELAEILQDTPERTTEALKGLITEGFPVPESFGRLVQHDSLTQVPGTARSS
jgi:A/G-specific adenine glycosylase